MKNWSSPCYKHFKPPVIIEEKGEIKYQFSCRACVLFFPLYWASCSVTEILRLSSRGNARRTLQPTFSGTSNPARVKWSKTQKVSHNTHMGPRTARPNCDIWFLFGLLNVIVHSLSLKMSPSNVFSRCCMQRSKHHHGRQFHGISGKSMPSPRSMWGKFFG